MVYKDLPMETVEQRFKELNTPVEESVAPPPPAPVRRKLRIPKKK
jgi:hypothetical protein